MSGEPSTVEGASTPTEKPKSRVVAALLGLVAPGLGHVFVGHTLRGAAWLVAPFIPFTLFIAFAHEPSMSTVFAVLGGVVLVSYVGSIIDAALIPVRRHRPTFIPAVIAFAVAPIVLAPVIAVMLRFFVVEAFKVPSGAMIPTIAVGDHLFVDKSVYRGRTPRRGDVIVFAYPEHPEQDFIKRVDRRPRRQARGARRSPDHQRLGGPELLRRRYAYTEALDGRPHEGGSLRRVPRGRGVPHALRRERAHRVPGAVSREARRGLGHGRQPQQQPRLAHVVRRAGRRRPRENIKGRARLIWLSPTASHQGADSAADPVAPSPELAAPLAQCLASRPPLAKTTPPAGK